MKRFIQLAMVLLLAMALLLVACDPKMDEPSTGSGSSGTGSNEPGSGSGEPEPGSDDPEPTQGEPLWAEEPITVDNAAAAIRAFFNDMERMGLEQIDIVPDKPILNLIGRPLAQQLGDSDKESLKAKLLESGITTNWADGELGLAKKITEGSYKGDYVMAQDNTTGNWTFSAKPEYSDHYEGEASKEGSDFKLEKWDNKESPSGHLLTTFHPSVCAYDEVLFVTDYSGEGDFRGSIKTTQYFVDGNIPDGGKILEFEFAGYDADGNKLFGQEKSYAAGHIDGVHVANGQITDDESTQKARAWFPEEDGQLPIPDALKDLGIAGFTIKGCLFSTDVYDMDNSTFSIFVDNDDPIRFTVTETIDEVETMLAPKFEKVSRNFKPKDADSPIQCIYFWDSPDHTTLAIEFKEDASLAPFVALVD